MQQIVHNISGFNANFIANADGVLPAHTALANQMASLGQTVLQAKAYQSNDRQSFAHIEKIRQLAIASGFSTVAAVVRTLESELAGGGRMRAITCYMEALQDALDIDSMAVSGGAAVNVRPYQEALLASLALRMHG